MPEAASALPRPLATYIDHTLLKPEATEAAVVRLAEEAAAAGFAAACVPPCHVAAVARVLAGTQVAPCTVIAFPLGYTNPEGRIAESLRALEDGATELDTVVNLSLIKSGEDGRAGADLALWVEQVRRHHPDAVLKVILETGLLTAAETERAARVAVLAGADFLKTSTGFGPGGATVEDVRLLARVAAGRARVKASGGIRTLEAAMALVLAGADRLGTSSGMALVAAAAEAGLEGRPS